MGRRKWTAVILAVVLLGTGACQGSDDPAAGSSPPTFDGEQYACNLWYTARRDFLEAAERIEITLANPDATQAEIHDQAVELVRTLGVLENATITAAAN